MWCREELVLGEGPDSPCCGRPVCTWNYIKYANVVTGNLRNSQRRNFEPNTADRLRATDNKIRSAGIALLEKALKVNNTLNHIDIAGTWREEMSRLGHSRSWRLVVHVCMGRHYVIVIGRKKSVGPIKVHVLFSTLIIELTCFSFHREVFGYCSSTQIFNTGIACRFVMFI